MGMISSWKSKARSLKRETYAIYLAYRDPRVPGYAKLFIAGVVAYAFSPIDLIPDFIPILGYLDDLVLIPIGVAIAIRMIPDEVMNQCRILAQETMNGEKPRNWTAGVIIIAVWIVIIVLFLRAFVL